MSEMIFEPDSNIGEFDESLGEFIDHDIISMLDSEYGMGQYSRALVYATSNVLMQLGVSQQIPLVDRMKDQAVTFFLIELVVLEEASLEIFNNAVLESVSGRTVKIFGSLLKTHIACKNFTDTMVFWDVKANYPSSRKSIEMIRKAFCIPELISRCERNQEELQMVFNTKCDIIDRMESSILNYIILFLTITQVLPLFLTDEIFGMDVVDKIAKLLLTAVLLYLYNITKNLALERSFRDRNRKRKRRFLTDK